MSEFTFIDDERLRDVWTKKYYDEQGKLEVDYVRIGSAKAFENVELFTPLYVDAYRRKDYGKIYPDHEDFEMIENATQRAALELYKTITEEEKEAHEAYKKEICYRNYHLAHWRLTQACKAVFDFYKKFEKLENENKELKVFRNYILVKHEIEKYNERNIYCKLEKMRIACTEMQEEYEKIKKEINEAVLDFIDQKAAYEEDRKIYLEQLEKERAIENENIRKIIEEIKEQAKKEQEEHVNEN